MISPQEFESAVAPRKVHRDFFSVSRVFVLYIFLQGLMFLVCELVAQTSPRDPDGFAKHRQFIARHADMSGHKHCLLGRREAVRPGQYVFSICSLEVIPMYGFIMFHSSLRFSTERK